LQASLTEAERENTAAPNERGIAADDKAKTTDDRNSDQSFLDDLTEQCQDKAAAWDERSKTRSAELTAIAGALSTLKGEVVGNYAANKKLVGFVAKHSQVAQSMVSELSATEEGDEEEAASDAEANMMFLQRSSLRAGVRGPMVKKVMNYLRTSTKQLKSDSLAALMIRMKEDHFVKVRGMIKDMISKLEADAAAEGDQKAWCDSEMEKATSQRDENIGNIEGDLAAKAKAESNIAKLEEEVQTLMEEISELQKALGEATELRNKEKA
jgi:hypothetical protein